MIVGTEPTSSPVAGLKDSSLPCAAPLLEVPEVLSLPVGDGHAAILLALPRASLREAQRARRMNTRLEIRGLPRRSISRITPSP